MSLPQNLHCGPCGWSYPHWNGIVYPKLKRRNFHALGELATYFDAVEINTTFYQNVRPEITRLWLRKVSRNPKFLFTAKLGRQFLGNLRDDCAFDRVALFQIREQHKPRA